jgi:hypothetical protein
MTKIILLAPTLAMMTAAASVNRAGSNNGSANLGRGYRKEPHLLHSQSVSTEPSERRIGTPC